MVVGIGIAGYNRIQKEKRVRRIILAEKYDPRKSDKIALTIKDMLVQGNAIEKFKKLKEKYGTINAIEWSNNVAYPVVLREGVFIKKCIREMGGKEEDWVKLTNLALLYYDGEVFGSGSE